LHAYHCVFGIQAVYEQRVKEVAMAVPLLCCAFDSFNVAAKRQIIISGARNAPDSEALLTACHAPFDPDKTVSARNAIVSAHLFTKARDP